MDDLKKQYLNDLRKSNVTDFDIKNSSRVLETFNLALKTFYDTQIDNNARLIDLGYGNGSFLKVLEKSNISSTGYDYDKINFESDKLPESSNSIDFVTCNSVIEHLSDVTNLFKEVHRILKPNGKFLLVTPNFYYDYKNFYDDPTHVNPFTVNKLDEVLKLFKFNKINIVPWVVKKNSLFWKIPFKFFVCRYFLITNKIDKIIFKEFKVKKYKLFLSISDEKDYSVAFTILQTK